MLDLEERTLGITNVLKLSFSSNDELVLLPCVKHT